MPDATPHAASTAPPALSVIIPAFNESGRIGPTLQVIADFATLRRMPVELLVIDDGSTDGTVQLVERFDVGDAPLTVRVLRNVGNRGKGFSVRRGMLEATGLARLMADADNSTPFEEVEKLLPWIAEGYDVVIGSRDMPESHLDPPQPWARRHAGRLFRAFRRRMLLPDIHDTQCGFKCFSDRAARDIFEQVIVDGFAFDCEVLALAEKLGYRIKEIGVTWHDHTDSRVRPVRDLFRAVRSLIQIRRRMQRFN